MKTLFERIRAHMPKFHSIDFPPYHVSVRSRDFLREWRPYFTGDTIGFCVNISSVSGGTGNDIGIYEVFNGKQERIWVRSGASIDDAWICVQANPIDCEGVVQYKFGFSYESAKTIISTHVIHGDRWLPALIAIAIATLFSCCSSFSVAVIVGLLSAILNSIMNAPR